MKKVIIAIHGLGNKPPQKQLENWWKQAIKEGLKIRGINKKLPKFELVYWADILYDKPLDQSITDKENPYYLDEIYTKASENIITENHDFRIKVLDFLTEQLNNLFLNDDKSLNYSYISDLILQKYFRDLELYYTDCQDETSMFCKVKERTRERLIQIIKKHKKHEIMLVAHSMGSIIAYDVLSLFAAHQTIHSFVTIGSPLGLPVIVSKIAQEQKSFQIKEILSTPPSVKQWFNLADITDSVAFNYKLADDFTANAMGTIPIDFLVTNNYEMNGIRNPHKSYGYLRCNEFSNIITDFIGEEKPWFGKLLYLKFREFLEKMKKPDSVA